MTRAKIAQFKNGLSRYLRQIRRGGEVVVMDRDRPVAKVVPLDSCRENESGFNVTPAWKPAANLKKIRRIRPKAAFDVLTYLWEDRRDT